MHIHSSERQPMGTAKCYGRRHTFLQPFSRFTTISRVTTCQTQTWCHRSSRPLQSTMPGTITLFQHSAYLAWVTDRLGRIRHSRSGSRCRGRWGPLGSTSAGAQELPREHDGDGEPRDGAERSSALRNKAEPHPQPIRSVARVRGPRAGASQGDQLWFYLVAEEQCDDVGEAAVESAGDAPHQRDGVLLGCGEAWHHDNAGGTDGLRVWSPSRGQGGWWERSDCLAQLRGSGGRWRRPQAGEGTHGHGDAGSGRKGWRRARRRARWRTAYVLILLTGEEVIQKTKTKTSGFPLSPFLLRTFFYIVPVISKGLFS